MKCSVVLAAVLLVLVTLTLWLTRIQTPTMSVPTLISCRAPPLDNGVFKGNGVFLRELYMFESTLLRLRGEPIWCWKETTVLFGNNSVRCLRILTLPGLSFAASGKPFDTCLFRLRRLPLL